MAKWLPAGAAGGLLVAVVAAGVISGGGDDSTVPASIASSSPIVATSTPDPTVTILPENQVVTEGSTIAKVPLGRTLSKGVAGDDVTMVQQRLVELGFDPGPVDGQYGGLTIQSVWAFEKLIMGTPRANATGTVTPEMWDRMQDPIKVLPRAPTGGLADHVEIYLPEQVMVVFHADTPAVITHISTGELEPGATGFTPWYETAREYCETVRIDTDNQGNLLEEPIEKAICGRSYTPPGVFKAYKKIEGTRTGALGSMWDPIYINQGIAIHGAINVPLQPASHGCIRVSQYLGAKLQSMIDLGDKVLIWDGVTDPWNQPADAQQMRFDYPDPNATTTTSTSTTTVPTTEPAPTTTQAPPPPAATTSTTVVKATTTTQAPPPTTAPPAQAPTTVQPEDGL